MKKLKIILQHNIIYYVFLFLVIVSYFINSNIEHKSIYEEFNNEKLTITNITEKDYGLKIDLKGKEKVLGFLYIETQEIKAFQEEYSIGDKVSVTGDIKEINENTVPNTFNYKKYLISNNIYNVIEITDIKKISDNKNIFYLLKNHLIERGKKLDKSYPYINSLLFGNNSYLDEEVVTSYRENGVSHLFAISGLHISIFITVLSIILDKMKIKEVMKYIILILFLLFYMFLTNFSMSVLRGAIFTILIFINKILKLNISTKNLLIMALCIILFNNPLLFNNVGLQYSFLVTLYLIIFKDLINKKGKIYSLFMISFIAFLVSYPITINNFNQVNFLSILYNIFFVPFVSSLLIPMVFISYIFPFIDNILYFLIVIIETTSQFLEQIDIGKAYMCKMNVLMIVSYYVGISLLLKRFIKKKYFTVAVLLIFFILHYFMPFKEHDYIIFFDVGQGDSALLSVNNTYNLIDTGGLVMYSDNEYTYKLSKNKLLPYFKSIGMRKIDNLILTHGDADHMKEAYYIVENFKVDRVIFNNDDFNYLEQELVKLLKKKNIKYCRNIRKLSVGEDKLHFLNHNLYDNENNNSNVIYFNYNGVKMLFMGDAGVKVEEDILENYILKNIDILKVGHHGSNTSSSKYFIDSISPKYSVISAGKNNRFGHPTDEILETLENSKVYRTDYDGSIMFYFDNNGLKIETYAP